MSVFIDKSQANLVAAEILKNKEALYDSSIHCSYYACIQMQLHIVHNKLKIDKQKFEADRRNNKDGTHGYASKLVGIELGKKDRQDFK